MNYLLYGNDIDLNTNPVEAGLGWITKFGKGDFIGKESIIKRKNEISKRIFCFSMLERAIPRKGCQILHDNILIGNVWPTIDNVTRLPFLSIILDRRLRNFNNKF